MSASWNLDPNFDEISYGAVTNRRTATVPMRRGSERHTNYGGKIDTTPSFALMIDEPAVQKAVR